jgi:hypothetical protein
MPDERAAGAVGDALGPDVACLVQGQLFPQEEVFCRKRGGGAQTAPQKPRGLEEKRAEHDDTRHQMLDRA